MPEPNQQGPFEDGRDPSKAKLRSQLGALLVFLERIGLDESDLQPLQMSQLGDHLKKLKKQLIGLVAGELPQDASESEISRAFAHGLKELLDRADDRAITQLAKEVLESSQSDQFLQDLTNRGKEEALTSLSRALSAAILGDGTNAFAAASFVIRFSLPQSEATSEIARTVTTIESEVEKKKVQLSKKAKLGWALALQGVVQVVFGLLAAPVAAITHQKKKEDKKENDESRLSKRDKAPKIDIVLTKFEEPLDLEKPAAYIQVSHETLPEVLHLVREEDWRRRKREQQIGLLRFFMALSEGFNTEKGKAHRRSQQDSEVSIGSLKFESLQRAETRFPQLMLGMRGIGPSQVHLRGPITPREMMDLAVDFKRAVRDSGLPELIGFPMSDVPDRPLVRKPATFFFQAA